MYRFCGMYIVKVLFMDDDLNRHEVFLRTIDPIKKELCDRYSINLVVQRAFSGEEALQKIKADLADDAPYDIMYLDHDLAESHYVAYKLGEEIPTATLDGRGFVREALQLLSGSSLPKQVVVHSWNFYAAAEMVAMLRDAGVPAHAEAFNESTGKLLLAQARMIVNG